MAAGAYDLAFALYATQTGGQALWQETQTRVATRGGSFSVQLGSVTAIPEEVLAGDGAWLAVAVRGAGEEDFTTLAPRQRVSAAAVATSEVSAAAGAACPHDHFGEIWSGSRSGPGLIIGNEGGTGLSASGGATGVVGSSTDGAIGVVLGRLGVHGIGDGVGVYGESFADGGIGVEGYSVGSHGVYGSTAGNGSFKSGVYGRATKDNANGVTGWNTGAGPGVYAYSESGYAGYFRGPVYASSNGTTAALISTGSTKDFPALFARNDNTNQGMAAYLVNYSDYHNTHLDNIGTGGVLFLQNNGDATGAGGGDFITASSRNNDVQFRVQSDGTVRNDTGIYTNPADFAEMLPAVEGLQAGDVLVIGAEGKLTRSVEPYQTSVAGVYSTEPGFVGGYPMDGATAGTIPLAIVGVVPVKASAENGPIAPGDLLVASATPGRAMKAGPSPPIGSVIGKALERLGAGQDTGVIKALVTLQ